MAQYTHVTLWSEQSRENSPLLRDDALPGYSLGGILASRKATKAAPGLWPLYPFFWASLLPRSAGVQKQNVLAH